MTIDPGLGGTGFALWGRNFKLEHSGYLKDRNIGSYWYESAHIIAMQLDSLLREFAGDELLIKSLRSYYELPAFFHGSVANASQDIIKLTMTAGIVAEALNRWTKYFPTPVEILHWKGQLKKEMSSNRIRKILATMQYEPRTQASHELDAIGIGLFLTGRF